MEWIKINRMEMRKKEYQQPKPISGVIGKILSSFGLSGDYHGWMVVSKWEEIVGEEIANRAKAVRFENGLLYVAVEDDTWRQEISMKLDEIMEQIRSYPFGRAIKQIRLIKRGKEL